MASACLAYPDRRDNNEAAQQAAMAGMAGPQLFLQFVTRYLHWSGELRCRVTTVTRRWVDGGNVAELIQGEGVRLGGRCGRGLARRVPYRG